jgi:hypothetical protein
VAVVGEREVKTPCEVEGGENEVTRWRGELVRVDEATDGARERCENDDNLGFPGRPTGVSLGVGSVSITCGTSERGFPCLLRSALLEGWGYIHMELSGLASAVYRDGPAAVRVVHEVMCVGSKSYVDPLGPAAPTINGTTSDILSTEEG